MFCTECGVSTPEDSRFCSSCGSAISAPESVREQVVEIAIRQFPQDNNVGLSINTGYENGGRKFLSETYSGLSMNEAIKSVFSKYAKFEGRATRSEYWFFALFNFLIYVGLIILGTLIASINSGYPDSSYFVVILMFVWALVILLPTISVSVRRLHDAGYSGWLYLLGLIPYLGGIVLFVFALLISERTDNKWGRAPKPFTARF